MKTAVEWLVEAYEELNKRCLDGTLSWFKYSDEKRKLEKQAKQIEKEQIINAYCECWGNDGGNANDKEYEAIQYYNETYKNTNDEPTI